MTRILLALAALIGGCVFTAPGADAQVIECQVTGVLVIIALNGPVTVCAFDTQATNSNTLDATANIPVTIPKLFTPAPPLDGGNPNNQ